MATRPHTAFKHLKRSNTYVNSTKSLWFSPDEMLATSYGWWPFLMKIGGKVVFQIGRYSSSTQKHQAHVRNWLFENGIEYIRVDAGRAPLDQPNKVLNSLRAKADALIMETKRKRTHKQKNAERLAEARRYLTQEKMMLKLYKEEGLIA